MGQHRLADDVADGEDVGDVRAQLLVDRDEAALVDLDPGGVGAELARRSAAGRRPRARGRRSRVGRSPRTRRSARPRWPRPPRPGPQVDRRVARLDALAQRLTRSGSPPGMSWSSSSTTVTRGAERVVDRRHLQADDPAADDEQPLGDRRELERAGGVHDPRVVGQVGDRRRARAGGDDRVVERDLLVRPTSSAFGPVNVPLPVTTSTLRPLAIWATPPVSLPTTPSFQLAQLVEVDLRLAEATPCSPSSSASAITLRDVQQRLGRDAADVEADAAERLVALDEHDVEAEVGGAEGRRVAARARAEDERPGHRRRIVVAVAGGLGRGVGRLRRRRLGGARLVSAPRRGAVRLSSVSISEPSETLSPTFTQLADLARRGTGTSIVALSDSRTTSGSSSATSSPAATSTSMMGTSVKSPMSGTLTSALTAGPGAGRRARRRGGRQKRAACAPSITRWS